MKYNNRNIKWISLVVLLIALSLAACKENDDLGTPDRLFRPVISETTFGGTWILYKWDKYADVDHYELQLSTDSFITFVSEVQTDTTFYKFEDLEYDTNYYLRIKSVGANLESNFFVNDIIKTSDYPTKLNPISSSDVIDSQVKVTWEDVNYDSLLVYNADNILVKSVILTEADNQAKQVIIKSLTPETSYVVKAYSDGGYQGKKTFETVAPQIFNGDVVDLRDYTDEESYSILTQELFDSLAVEYPSGFTLVLSGGTHYEMSTLKLTAPLNMVTGYSLNGKAIIEVKGNFDADADVVVGNVHLEKLTFTDHADKPRTDSNFGGTYIMNISGSGSVIDTFSIEDCDIRYKRGVLRIKTGATVTAVSINNCFIDSIGGYGIVNLDNSGVITNSISVTNSTIAHTELFLRSDKMTQNLTNMTVSYVTTYDTPTSYFFRMGNIDNVEISYCLFGAVKNPDSGAEGLRSGDISTSLIRDNYRTSDCNWPVLTDSEGNITGDKNPIESTQLSESSAEIFGDVDANNYTVTDSRLQDKIGDPRWW